MNTIQRVEIAFKRLKTEIYNENSDLFIRRQLSDFENNRQFKNKLKKLGDAIDQAIINKSIFPLQQYLSSVKKAIAPKNFNPLPYRKNKDGTDISIITNRQTYHYYEVAQPIFFIDAPIEVHIISILWLEEFGPAFDKQMSPDSYANKLALNKKGKFKTKLFEAYFNRYGKWRDNALNEVERRIDKKKGAVIVSLDIKNFYHSVDFDFEDLPELTRKSSLSVMLTMFIKVLHSQYSELLNEKKNILPIGLMSSPVLANWYLRHFDKAVRKDLQPLYYGRYVDDLLFVINEGNKIDDVDEFLYKHFFRQNILGRVSEGTSTDYTVLPKRYRGGLLIQKRKIVIQEFSANSSKAMLEKFKAEIRKNSSEFRLLPLGNRIDETFGEASCSIIYSDSINKIRSIKGVREDKHGISIFLRNQILSSISPEFDKTKKNKTEVADDLNSFFRGQITLELYSQWEKVITFFVVNELIPSLNLFLRNALTAISKLKIEKNEKNEKVDIEEIKDYLTSHLLFALSLALSLKGKTFVTKAYSDLSDLVHNEFDRQEILWYYDSIRKSNLLRHNYLRFPLLNYIRYASKIYNFDLTTGALPEISRAEISAGVLEFDLNKISFNPRFVPLHEVSLWLLLRNIMLDKKQDGDHLEEAFKAYLSINSFSWDNSSQYYTRSKREAPGEDVPIEIIGIGDQDVVRNSMNVAIANIKISDADYKKNLEGVPNVSSDRMKTLFSLVNQAFKESPSIDILALPEVSVPVAFLLRLCSYANSNNMGLILGLEHLTYKGKAYNISIVSLPIKNNGRNSSILIPRIKNHYPDKEIELIKKNNLEAVIPQRKYYNLIRWRGSVFSVFNCFELADITHRKIFKGLVDFLVTIENNRDIWYFANIAESVSRDIHAYFLQVNNSDYGDSRLTQPKSMTFKNILQVKGGNNSTILTATLDIEDLRYFQIHGKHKKITVQNEEWKPLPPGFDRNMAKNR
jgi:hypothetical protein